MTIEPVAYLNTYSDGSTNITRENITFKLANPSKPLYTKEQLQPRVKMTQAEFDEFIILRRAHDYSIKRFIIIVSNGDIGCPLLKKRYFIGVEEQLALANLWANYIPEKLEEMIEIVPTMKWFVRSKKANHNGGYYRFRSGVKDFGDYYYTKDKNDNKIAYPFGTKEEAELWTNPLTEAVLLSVED